MSAKDDDSRVEVLPPAPSRNTLPEHLVPNGDSLVMAIVQRVQLWGARRVRQSLTAVLYAETLAIEAAERRNLAIVSLRKSQVRLEHLDDIVEAERRLIQAELEQQDLELELETVQLRTRLEDAKFQQEYQKAVREVEQIRKDLERDRLTQPREKRDPLSAELDSIKKRADYLKEGDVFAADLCKKQGVESEDQLDERAQTILRQFREAIELGV